MLLPAVATLGSSSNEPTSTSTTISCRLPFLSFSGFSCNLIKFGPSDNQKNWVLLPFMSLRLQPYTRQLMDICAFLPSGSEWRNHKMVPQIRSIAFQKMVSGKYQFFHAYASHHHLWYNIYNCSGQSESTTVTTGVGWRCVLYKKFSSLCSLRSR